MSELGSGSGSSYPTTKDTDNTQETSSDSARVDVPNDIAAAIVAIQGYVGVKGTITAADISTYLKVEHNDDGTHGTITSGSITSAGNISTSGDLITTGSGDLTIAGNSAIAGNETVTGTLDVTGNGTVGGTFDVTGNGTVGGTLGVTGDTTLTGDLVLSKWSAFKATISGVPSIPSSTETKIEFDGTDFDKLSEFDVTTDYRFEPLNAGRYFLVGQAQLNAISDGNYLQLSIIDQSGTTINVARAFSSVALGSPALLVSAVVETDGTDRYHLSVYHTEGASKLLANTANFSGFRIA